MVAAGAKVILITPSDTKAIVPAIKKARDKGVLVIALDSPTDPPDATDALFATDNYKAGALIGQYAKAALAASRPRSPRSTCPPASGRRAAPRRLPEGLRPRRAEATSNDSASPPMVCMADSYGDQAKGQTAMENCLQKNPDINVVYTINEPAAAGAYTALKAGGQEKDVVIVSVDGGCQGVKDVERGQSPRPSQQYPLKMAEMGVEAGVAFVKTGKKPSGYTDTGVTLIAAKPIAGVESKDVKTGIELSGARSKLATERRHQLPPATCRKASADRHARAPRRAAAGVRVLRDAAATGSSPARTSR